MAWYRVAYRPDVVGDLNKIDKGMAQRLFDKTKWLASNVDNLRHEPLDVALPGLCQYAAGDWRILYSINKEDHVLDIHLIGTSSELYQRQSSQKTHEPTRAE